MRTSRTLSRESLQRSLRVRRNHSRAIQCSKVCKKPSLVGLTKEQKHIWIDINERIFRELVNFLKLYFLEHAFDDCFEQITKTLKLVVDEDIDDFEWNVTVGRYKKELALLTHERESQPIISKCIEEMRQELEKYERGDSEDLEGESLDKRIDKIIRSYGILYNRCPKFFNVCGNIILSSRLIRYELIEQGIDRLLDKAEG